MRVLCPRRLPAGRWVVNHRTLRNGRCQYLLDLETRPFGSDDPFHVLAGGRCGQWPLRTRSRRWPTRAPLRLDLGLVGIKPLQPGRAAARQEHVPLRVLGEARVAGHAALLLASAPYPRGGLHGGHTVAVWNQDASGYALSMHFHPGDRSSAAEQEALVLRVADAMARADG